MCCGRTGHRRYACPPTAGPGAEVAREWMRQDIGGKEATEIAADGSVSAGHFTWHPVSRAVGNVKNQGP